MTGKKGRKCSILLCRSFQHTHKHMSFFRFPKDPERCKVWIANSGRPELAEKLAVYEDRVCEKHFEPHMFLNDYRNRLQHSAVPVLFLDADTDTPPRNSLKVPALSHPSQQQPSHQRRPIPKLEAMRPSPHKSNGEPDYKRFKATPPNVELLQVMQPKKTAPPPPPPPEPLRKYARIGPTKQIYMEAANEVGMTGMSYRKAAEKFNINAVNLRRFCIRLAKTLKAQPSTELHHKQLLEQQQLEQYLMEQQHLLLQQQLQQKQLKHARQRKSFAHQTAVSKKLPPLLPCLPPASKPMNTTSTNATTTAQHQEEVNTPSPTIYKRPRQIFSIDQEDELAVHVRDTSDYYGGMSSKDVRTLAYVFGTCNQVDMPSGWQETHQASFDWCLGFIKRNKLTPVITSKGGGPGRPPAMLTAAAAAAAAEKPNKIADLAAC